MTEVPTPRVRRTSHKERFRLAPLVVARPSTKRSMRGRRRTRYFGRVSGCWRPWAFARLPLEIPPRCPTVPGTRAAFCHAYESKQASARPPFVSCAPSRCQTSLLLLYVRYSRSTAACRLFLAASALHDLFVPASRPPYILPNENRLPTDARSPITVPANVTAGVLCQRQSTPSTRNPHCS